jgi:hypothetical protein
VSACSFELASLALLRGQIDALVAVAEVHTAVEDLGNGGGLG